MIEIKLKWIVIPPPQPAIFIPFSIFTFWGSHLPSANTDFVFVSPFGPRIHRAIHLRHRLLRLPPHFLTLLSPRLWVRSQGTASVLLDLSMSSPSNSQERQNGDVSKYSRQCCWSLKCSISIYYLSFLLSLHMKNLKWQVLLCFRALIPRHPLNSSIEEENMREE